jgi:malate dehydrogenase (oxaloacetate-decarboxylating)
MQPTVLIGLSTAHGAFHEQLVRGMMAAVQRPIIFPLSNPTSRSEADPADLWRWTDGRALIATGSPYPPLRVDGVSVPVAQSNNVFVFPGLGLGAIAARATQVTDGMLQAAATALGALSPILAGSNRRCCRRSRNCATVRSQLRALSRARRSPTVSRRR